MGLKLRRKSDGLTVFWDSVSLSTGPILSDEAEFAFLPDFMKNDYELVKGASSGPKIPDGGWESLTLDNFEQKMGYRFRIDGEASMRGLSREVAFLQFLEKKGVKRSERLIEGLTLENFKEKTGHRFRMTKEDVGRSITRERAFEIWKQRNGYT